jgi:hypothetical protein
MERKIDEAKESQGDHTGNFALGAVLWAARPGRAADANTGYPSWPAGLSRREQSLTDS